MPRRNPEDQEKFMRNSIAFANILLTGTDYHAEKALTGRSYFNIKHKDGTIREAVLTNAELSAACAKIAKESSDSERVER